MYIDGQEYKFNLPVYCIELKDLSADNKNLQKIFSAFDDGSNLLNRSELKNIFAIFQNMDVTGKDNKADNKLTDEEIRQAISSNEKLKDFSVGDIKLFIKTLVKANNKNLSEFKKYSKYIAQQLYDQISGPSLNKNTINKLKSIDSNNAYYVLTEYEKIAKEPLVQALGEEWNFFIGDIKHYVLKPLVMQASSLGIEVSEDYYKNENDTKKLNELAKTLCSAIAKELNNPQFGTRKSSAQKLTSETKTQKSAAGNDKKTASKNKEKPADIAKQLYDQISGPSMKKNTIAILKKIDTDNVAQVVSEYKKIAGESLADALNEEWGLDINTVKEYICKPLILQAKNLELIYSSKPEDKYKNLTSMDSINNFIDNWSKKIIETTNNRKDIPQKINFNDYKLDALKAKYPDKECRQMGSIILIKNRNGSTFMKVEKANDGRMTIYDKYDKNDDYTRYMCYNADGTLDYFRTNGLWKGRPESGDYEDTQTDLNNKVNELFEDIYHKIGGIIPGTRTSLKDNIKQIAPGNILEIMALYQSKTGESLFDAIDNEVGLGDTRKILTEHLNTTLDKAFNQLSEKDIMIALKDFQSKTDLSLLESISKNSGMPKDKKQAFIDKINQNLQKFVRGINSNNIEEIFTKYQDENISITELISKESGLPDSVRKSYIKNLTNLLSQHIKDMDIYNYASTKIKDDYDDIEGRTLTSVIANEKGISPAEKVKLIRQLETRIMNEYAYQSTAKNDIKRQISAELDKITKNPETINVELIDKLNSKLYNRDGYYAEWSDEQNLQAPNGKIDNIAYQGGTGDCWLLASINAIARSKKGLNMLNNSLKVNSDGSVTVRLNGVNKSYTISKEDLYGARELSTGDLDVRAIEIAVERYMMEYRHDDINGDYASVAFDILIGGNKSIWHWNGTELDDSYKDRINNPDILVTACIINKDRLSKGVKTTDGQDIHANHVYTVVRADDKYVYLINPWDSGKLLKLSYNEFKNIFDQFTDVEL